MQNQQYEDKQLLVSRVTALALEIGKWANSRYELSIPRSGYEIKVRDILTGKLVAYSSTKADFNSSLEEFTWDYFADVRE